MVIATGTGGLAPAATRTAERHGQVQPDLLLDIEDREEGDADSDDGDTVDQRHRLGPEYALEERDTGDRELSDHDRTCRCPRRRRAADGEGVGGVRLISR